MTQKDDDGQEWWKERMYGAKDTVLWAILTPDRVEGMPNFRVVGSFLREEDADQAIADHRDAQQLRERVNELEALFDLQWRRFTQELLPRWRAEGRVGELEMPDYAQGEEWILQRAEAAEERVRVLEEALRDILGYLSGPNGLDVPEDYRRGGEAIWRFAERGLLSPAAATEGGEGA